MIENQDVQDLIGLLNQNEVLFMLVGGYAVIHYAEPRFTKDIDFFVKASTDNAARIVSALVEFGVSEGSLNPNLFANKGNFYKIGRPPWRVDLITSLKNANFDQLYSNSEQIEFAGHSIKIISKQDLINVKKNAGRSQDLLDVEKLER